MFKFTNESTIMKDDFLNSSYYTIQAKASELSLYLRETLKKNKIDPDNYNQNKDDSNFKEKNQKNLLKNPPTEIYEYQPFFLLKRRNGEYTLLDGFRRLLWYNAPNHTINIRVYDEKDVTSQQIMKLMVYLNHFKFYLSGGEYYDRGFSLAMKVIFDLDIPKYYKVFDAYLSLNDISRKYWKENIDDIQKNSIVKDRLLNPMFISDMKFVENILDSNIMLNDVFGSLMFKMRMDNPTKEFDSVLFLDKIKNNKIIIDLQNKFKKNGDGTGAEAQKIVNQIIPLYENIFIEMFGGDVEKTYAEIKDDVKLMVDTLRKDKTLTKLTGNQNTHLIEKILSQRLKDKTPINFKCIIQPKPLNVYDYGDPEEKTKNLMEPGLLKKDIVFLENHEKNFGGTEMVFGFKDKIGIFKIAHNYGGWNSYGRKYTKLRCWDKVGMTDYDIDLFVDIKPSEIKDLENKKR